MIALTLLSTVLLGAAPLESPPKGDQAKISVCPRSEVTFRFETGGAELSAEDERMLDAFLNRALHCNLSALILYTEAPVTDLTEQRVSVLTEALIARGVNRAVMTRDLTPNFSRYPMDRPATGVTLLADFA